jgi:hypothetical protein
MREISLILLAGDKPAVGIIRGEDSISGKTQPAVPVTE